MIKKLSLPNSITLIALVCVSSLSSLAYNTQGELRADGATLLTSQMLARDYYDLEKIKNQTNELLQRAQYLFEELPINSPSLPQLTTQANGLKNILTEIDNAEKQRSDISPENYMQIKDKLDTIESNILTIQTYNLNLEKIKNQTNKLQRQAQHLLEQLPANSLFLPLLKSQTDALKNILAEIDNAEKQRSDISTEKHMQIENMLKTIKSNISKIETSVVIELQNKGER